MCKKISIVSIILCFLLLSFGAKAQEYDSGHPFFQADFWKKASVADVQKEFVNTANINAVYTWVSSVELVHLQGVNLLAFAIYWGATPEIAELLIKNGATITSDALQYAKNLDMLQLLVKHGGNVNGLNANNETPIMNAVNMTIPMVEFLLQQGAAPNVKNISGDTALSYLYDFGPEEDVENWQAKVALLEKAGAKLGEGKNPQQSGIITYKVKKNTEKQYTLTHNFYNPDFWRAATLADVKQSFITDVYLGDAPKDALGNAPFTLTLKYTTDASIVDFLMEQGVGAAENEMLNAAAQNENVEILKTVMSLVPSSFSEHGLELDTPAKLAAQAGLAQNVFLLIKEDPSIRYKDFAEGKFFALEEVLPSKGRPERAQLVAKIQSMPIEYGPEHPFFSLWGFEMDENGVPNLTEHLIEGADLDSTFRWPEGVEMVHYDGCTILEMALLRDVPSPVIEFLVKNGATITADAMAYAQSLAMLKTLIKLGGNVKAVTTFDATPLFGAAIGDTEMLKFLLQQGVSPNIKAKDGDTALTQLYYSDQYNLKDDKDLQERVRLLKAAGAKMDAGIRPKKAGVVTYKVKENTEKIYNSKHNYTKADFWRVATLEDVKQSFIEGEDLNHYKTKNESPILANAAAQTAEPTIVEFLINNGAKVGEEAMLAAARNEHTAILETLIKHGGNVDSHWGFYVALSAAAEAGLKDNVALLLAKGADVNNGDFEFGNALCVTVVHKGRPDRAAIVKMLKAAGGKKDCGGGM